MTDLSILNVFETKVRKNIIDFCKDLNNTNADIYVVMARKAACLVSVLEKLSLLTLHGEVISERVLDCKIDWNKYKSVIIIDDVVISGTTLYQTIARIKSEKPSIRLDLYVLGVNSDWYKNDVLEDENGISYIHSPIRYYDNSECIRLSGDIVQMLAQYPVPYNIDFPIYNTLRLNGDEYRQIMSLPGWKISEVLSFSHEKNDIFTHTFIPQIETLENCGSLYVSETLRHSLLKIRTYCRCRTDKKHEVYLLTIVPMLIMPPLEYKALNEVFYELSGANGNELSQVLISNTSRLRFVQFVLADIMAKKFIQSTNILLCTNNEINREYGSLRYLFPSSVINLISKIADRFEGLLDITIPYKKQIAQSDGKEIHELLDVNEVLGKPFVEMYYKDELRSRQLVREYGKNVFNEKSYTEAIDRLKRGISLTELISKLKGIDENKRMSFVSAFLDRTIDEGIVVPITVEKDGLVYRAFRHGEDVQFGQQEERLCYDMLSVFAKQTGRNEIPKLWMEKMLVLLFQLGEGELFLPIQTSLGSFGNISGTPKLDRASVKYYLQGPLVVRLPKNSPFSKQYLETKDKTDWMTSFMLNTNYSPVRKAESGMFFFDQNIYKDLSAGDNQIVIDKKKTQFAKNIGLLFGHLLANASKKIKPSINSDDMVMLTSSLETKNVIGALAAEINICYGQFIRQDSEGIYNILKSIVNKQVDYNIGFEQIRKSVWYQALNDGNRKFVWYEEHNGYRLINEIAAQFDDELYKTTWESMWSPNMEYKGNVEKEEVVNIAVVEGLWILCAYTYYLMLYCLVIKENGNDTKIQNAVEKILELYTLLNKQAGHYYVRDILPIVAEFLEKYNNTQYSIENKLLIFDRLVVLFNRCPNILDTASDYYYNTLKLPRVRSFNHAMFVETSSANEIKAVKLLYEKIRFKISKSENTETTELLMIQNSDDVLLLSSNQFVFVANNEKGLFWLLQMAKEANSAFKGRCDLRIVIYSNLHPDCYIKVLSDTRFEPQSFGDLFLGTSEVVASLPFSTDAIYVLSEWNKDIRGINTRYKNYVQTYVEEHEFYLPNKRNFKLFKYQNMENDLRYKVDIGIITIVDEEAAAVRTGFGMDIDNPIVINNHYYDTGKHSVNGKNYKIVHFQCPKQGNITMALAVIELVKCFNPDSVVLLGIAGAIQNEINIGDVVIADDVFYYESRKEKADGVIDRRLKSYHNSTKMSNQIVRYRSIINQGISGETRGFSLHVAPVGTGEAVIGDSLSEIKKWLLSVHSKTCAVETEAAGFSEAMNELSNESVDHLIIRGISDKADVDKNDKYRRIASDNAVVILKDFIDRVISRLP